MQTLSNPEQLISAKQINYSSLAAMVTTSQFALVLNETSLRKIYEKSSIKSSLLGNRWY